MAANGHVVTAQKLKEALAQGKAETVLSCLRELDSDQDAINEVKLLYGGGLENDIRAKLSGSDRANALYLLQGRKPSGAKNGHLYPQDPKPAGPLTRVGEGYVYALTETCLSHKTTKAPTNLDAAFAFIYDGKDADQLHWLQFIWREAFLTAPGEPAKCEKGKITTTGGEYPLTTDLSDKTYNVDVTPSAVSPFYDDCGACVRLAGTVVAMFDQPTAGHDDESALYRLRTKDAGTVLDCVAHFDTFLVKQHQCLYHFELTVSSQWKRTDSRRSYDCVETVFARRQRLVSQQAVSVLPNQFHATLLKRFPKFDYLTMS